MSAEQGQKGKNRRQPGILAEVGILMIAITAICVIVVESVALMMISRAMTEDLRAEASRTTEETVAILEVPLYILDDDQCIRIGQTLLASGRISGIQLVSSYSDTLLNVPTADPDSSIASTSGTIEHEGVTLGSYRFDFSDRQIRDTNAKIINVIFWVILTVIVSIGLAIRYILVARLWRETSPVLDALTLIQRGDYGTRIPESRYGDINRIIVSINEMAGTIQKNSEALVRANQTLEQKVSERTEALRQSLEELEQTQDRLVHSEKMSALGNLSAGIAHELNTPLGAILSSNRIIVDFFNRDFSDTLRAFSSLNEKSQARFLELFEFSRDSAGKQDLSLSTRKQRLLAEETLNELHVARAGEIAERLVELGLRQEIERMGTWLAEEDSLELLDRASPVSIARRMAEVIEIAGGKAANVVAALRSYLSTDDSKRPGYLDLEDELEKVLTLMQNLLKHGVAVERRYCGAVVRGSPEKLGQVWLNIIRNAVQAMDFRGTLTITTELADNGNVRVSFADTGPGIPKEIGHRIFEPFFSTKRSGEGMGIGLDICRRIVEGHGGTIKFESEPGRTVFTVTLPDARAKDVKRG